LEGHQREEAIEIYHKQSCAVQEQQLSPIEVCIISEEDSVIGFYQNADDPTLRFFSVGASATSCFGLSKV